MSEVADPALALADTVVVFAAATRLVSSATTAPAFMNEACILTALIDLLQVIAGRLILEAS
jgi:hypothetical protein